MKKDIIEYQSKASYSDKKKFVLVEDILKELYPAIRTSILVKLRTRLLLKNSNLRARGEKNIVLFIASGQRIDNKIDNINQRIDKRFK